VVVDINKLLEVLKIINEQRMDLKSAWIDPRGNFEFVSAHHVQDILIDPEKFNLSFEQLESWSGFSEEVIKECGDMSFSDIPPDLRATVFYEVFPYLLDRGWIRFSYSNREVAVEINQREMEINFIENLIRIIGLELRISDPTLNIVIDIVDSKGNFVGDLQTDFDGLMHIESFRDLERAIKFN